MSLTFSNYKNQRDSHEFNFKFDALCESIIENNVDFFDFWHENVLPVMETTQAQDENELLNEFFGLFNKKNTGKQDFLGNMNRINNSIEVDKQKRMEEEKARNQAARDKKLADFQNRVNQQVDGVKKKFSMAMRDFVKNASDDAKNQNDPHLWQIVTKFSQKISDTANNYKINAAYGKDNYSEPFQQERDAMMKSMMKSKMDSTKQQLSNKFPNKSSVRGGNSQLSSPPVDPNPNFKPMTPGGPSGFMNKESIEPQNDMLVESLIRCTGSYK